jgi:hypothetical protein
MMAGALLHSTITIIIIALSDIELHRASSFADHPPRRHSLPTSLHCAFIPHRHLADDERSVITWLGLFGLLPMVTNVARMVAADTLARRLLVVSVVAAVVAIGVVVIVPNNVPVVPRLLSHGDTAG